MPSLCSNQHHIGVLFQKHKLTGSSFDQGRSLLIHTLLTLLQRDSTTKQQEEQIFGLDQM